MNGSDDDSSLSDDSDVAFALMDFAGVDFGDEEKIEEENVDIEVKPENKSDSLAKVPEPSLIPQTERKTYSNPTKDANDALLEGAKNLMNDKIDIAKESTSEKLISSLPTTIVFDRISAIDVDLNEEDKCAIAEEKHILLADCYVGDLDNKDCPSESNTDFDTVQRIRESSKLLSEGNYLEILNGPTAENLFECDVINPENSLSVAQRIRHCTLRYCTTVAKCVEVELLAAAGLNIFMQCNYTGPSLHHGGVSRPGKQEDTYETLRAVNPHPLFTSQLKVTPVEYSKVDDEDKQKEPPVDASFHNSVLTDLSADGEWPCPVCKYPYFLLLARSILLTLADPNRPDWTQSLVEKTDKENEHKIVIRQIGSCYEYEPPSEHFVSCAQKLSCAQIWSARATVAHSRLLQGDESSVTLWNEAKGVFDSCVSRYCENIGIGVNSKERILASKVLLEYGLAEHHFDKEKKGKPFFKRALAFSDLDVEVTGAEGKRTKYQQKATAQMLVRAKPSSRGQDDSTVVDKTKISDQEVKFEEDTILLERVKYEEDDDNVHFQLSLLHQTILLALCLDVKNDNPMDGLTGEQMGAYLERVLQQHDDWMVYATGLLERAWLESEKNHTRERALFQLQALADQHTNRLTLTQSTFQSAVEDSAPPQERLKNIHYIVYPPRWQALRDLAERYAKIGIVTSAAEMFEEIELWDEVVECYRRAGKEKKAEEVVRKRLSEAETPKMWAALGDITGEKAHYEKALHLSNGRYSDAHVALGKYYADKEELEKAAEQFKLAVYIKPLSPQIWFRLGALSMRLEDWDTALRAFTEVVEQEPEEGDAWANVAAIHMHNKNPGEAYPALNEVSKHTIFKVNEYFSFLTLFLLLQSIKLNRNNWRVWVSKVYSCMDLQKYDEAIQGCFVLIDLKAKRNESEGVPPIEEKVVRAIVNASVSHYNSALKSNDTPAIDSSKRTLSRVRDLISRIQQTSKESWLFEVSAFFNECIGRSDQAVGDLMKEYRSLVSFRGWETDSSMLPRICRVLSQILEIHLEDGDLAALKKLKFLVNGVIKKVNAAYFDATKLPSASIDALQRIQKNVESKLS